MPESDITPVEQSLRLWAKTLRSLAEPDRCRQLVDLLSEGDADGLERLLEPTQVLQFGACIDVVDTLIKLVNFGPGHFEEQCSVIARLRPLTLSMSAGNIYKLSDGRFVFVTEAEWWSYYDRASQDPAWMEQNRDLLKTLGIISCVQVWVPDDRIISIDRSRTICFPDVVNPFDMA